MTLAELGEAWLVAYIKDAFEPALPLPLGIGDDAAVIETGPRTVVCADAMVEGVHFDLGYWSPEDVGRKLVSVNVSDMAAMGARPHTALLTLSLPGAMSQAAATEIIDGVARQAVDYDVVVAGGDVTGSPGPTVLSLTLLGTPGARLLTRSTARPGQHVYVTGWPGLSELAYRQLSAGLSAPPAAADRFFRPVARVDEGIALTRQMAACMDLSDGLLIDGPRMARASGVEFVVDLDRIPLHVELGAGGLSLALCGGEDYELLMTCDDPPPFEATRIGVVRAGPPGVIWQRDGVAVELEKMSGFSHF